MQQNGMDVIVTHVKRIERSTGITKIMEVGEVVEEIGGSARPNLQKWGKVLVGDYVYHVIDTQEVMFDILGRLVRFEMRNGNVNHIKVMGIGFMGIIAGIDQEGMNVSINLANVDEYRLIRGGMN